MRQVSMLRSMIGETGFHVHCQICTSCGAERQRVMNVMRIYRQSTTLHLSRGMSQAAKSLSKNSLRHLTISGGPALLGAESL